MARTSSPMMCCDQRFRVQAAQLRQKIQRKGCLSLLPKNARGVAHKVGTASARPKRRRCEKFRVGIAATWASAKNPCGWLGVHRWIEEAMARWAHYLRPSQVRASIATLDPRLAAASSTRAPRTGPPGWRSHLHSEHPLERVSLKGKGPALRQGLLSSN